MFVSIMRVENIVKTSPFQLKDPKRDNRRVAFRSVGWGLISDVDIGTNNLPVMGGLRLTASAIQGMVSLRSVIYL